MARVEVFRGQARRRWSDEDKRRLVAETLAAGGTVHGVARRYGINTSQLFTWRKQLRTGADHPARPAAVPGFAAVTIASPAAFPVPSPAAETVSSGVPASSGLSLRSVVNGLEFGCADRSLRDALLRRVPTSWGGAG